MVGVLALQGNYQMHCRVLDKLGRKNILVKDADDLDICDGLIIPGGESTVVSKMMEKYALSSAIKKFSTRKGVFGTCAGLILMSDYHSESIKGLDILDINVSRNAWGRQIDSFTQTVDIDIFEKVEKCLKNI